jgi:OmpA-OmpF porin, OOP family
MGIKALEKVGCCLLLVAVNTLFAQPLDAENVGRMNSIYDEQNPVLSADGKHLFITRANHADNIGGSKDAGDIWISSFNGITWSPPVHGGAHLNNKGYNTVAGTSVDGRQLFIINHVGDNSEPAKSQGLSVSTFDGYQWPRPVNITIPYFHSRSPSICGQLAQNGSVFVYAADTYGTLGVEDIYITQLINGQWTEPRNLGPVINTNFQELSPSINKTGDTLFFSSNGRKGKGSFDVYATARLDDSWMNWSEPINLVNINSEGRELYYKSLGDGIALYTSTRNSDGYGDIRFFSRGQSTSASDSVIISANLVDPEKNADKIKIFGRVINVKSGEVIKAQIMFVSPGEVIAGKSGDKGYEVKLSSIADYKVAIEAQGFISLFEKLELKTAQSGSIELDFELQPIEIGATVNLKSVLFKQSSTDLLPESTAELNVVASFMQANPRVQIELTGHTDNRGVQKDNVKLSQARVQKVKDYLIAKGISSKRITGRGYGGSKPIANNDTEESRRLNRRVEFVIRKT